MLLARMPTSLKPARRALLLTLSVDGEETQPADAGDAPVRAGGQR